MKERSNSTLYFLAKGRTVFSKNNGHSLCAIFLFLSGKNSVMASKSSSVFQEYNVLSNKVIREEVHSFACKAVSHSSINTIGSISTCFFPALTFTPGFIFPFPIFTSIRFEVINGFPAGSR